MGKHNARTIVLMTIGLACYWPFFRRFEFSLFFTTRPDAAFETLQSYAVVMISCVAFALVALPPHERIERFIARNRPLVLIVSCAGAVGYALLLFVPAGPLMLAASITLGAGYVALTCIWALLLAGQKGNTPLICIAVSFPISSLLSLAILLPEPISLLFTMVSPAVSALAWFLLPGERTGSENPSARVFRTMPLGTLGIFCLFIVVGHLMVGALYQTDAFIPVSERIITTVLSSITLLLMAYLLAKSSAADTLLGKGWVLLATFYLAAAFLVLYVGSDLYHLGTGIIAAELNCFEIFFWILLVLSIRQTRISPVFAFCSGFLIIKAVPVGVAKLLLPSVFEWLNLRPSDYTAAFVAVMTFMLIIITVVFLNTRAFSPAEAASDGQARDKTCAAIAVEAGLTPREEEVMRMMAQGHSLKKIGETLFISTGTVQGHTKNIYRKLDVHSKQELIDLVDEHREPRRYK